MTWRTPEKLPKFIGADLMENKKERFRHKDFYSFIEDYHYTYKKKGQKRATTTTKYRARYEYRQEDGTFAKASRTFAKEYQAKDFLKKTEADYNKGSKASFETRDILLKDFAETYKASYLSQLKSCKDEAPKIDHAVGFFGNIRVRDLRRPQLDEYKAHLMASSSPNASRPNAERTTRTIDGYLVRIASLLSYAETAEVITSLPSFKKLLLRKYNKRKETITLEEFFQLLDACDQRYNVSKDGKHWEDRKHLKLWLIGLHETAARSSELARVTVRDIDLKKRIVKIWEGKRWEEEQRSAYISDLLFAAIVESGVMGKSPDTLVFGNQKSYKTAFARAKELARTDENRRVNFLLRDLRRTGITNMFKSGMSLASIKKQVGHKSNSGLTEEVYLSLNDDFIVENNQQYETYMRNETAKIKAKKKAAC